MQIALNTIALEPARWSPDKSGARPLEALIPLIAKAGYRTCEVWQHHLTNRSPDEAPGFLELAKHHGVGFAVIGAYPLLHLEGAESAEQMAMIERLMDACAVLGSDVLKIFAGRIASAKITTDERERSVSFLRELPAKAADRGLTVTAETHGNTLADSPEAAESLQTQIAAPNFGYCYQPFDLTDSERALPDYEALKDRVCHVHLQGRDDNGFSLLQDAVFDYAAFLRRLRETGFDGVLSVEFVRHCQPDEGETFSDEKVVASAAADLAFIEQVWAE